jgi:hypothetical protein
MPPDPPVSNPPASWPDRIQAVERRGRALNADGLPFDTDGIVSEIRSLIARHESAAALTALGRAEALLERSARDWAWLKDLLSRVDELKDLAAKSGVDLEVVDQRLGNARAQLQSVNLENGALEKAAASASLALVVLNDTLPKFYAQETQQLAKSLREAHDRGEDMREAAVALQSLVQAMREGRLQVTAQRFIELRRAVARIPPAPAVPPQMLKQEEEEILLEARNLARRLSRVKYRARDAQGAARLMSQVRAALSEDRRYGTPEEELEELWGEVDRLARERTSALAEPPAAAEPDPPAEEPPDAAAKSEPDEAPGDPFAPLSSPRPALRRGETLK